MGLEEEILGLRGEVRAERLTAQQQQREARRTEATQQQNAANRARFARDRVKEVGQFLTSNYVLPQDIYKSRSHNSYERARRGWLIFTTTSFENDEGGHESTGIGLDMQGDMLFMGPNGPHTLRLYYGNTIEALSVRGVVGNPEVVLKIMELRGFRMGLASLVEFGEPYQDKSRDYLHMR